MAYSIDPRTGNYTYDYYAPLDVYAAVHDEVYNGFSFGTLGELTYTYGAKSRLPFEGWDWAE